MSTNCSACLSPKATWEYVGQVASILLGAKAHMETLGGESIHCVVKGFGPQSFGATHTPEYIFILVDGDVSNPAARDIQDSDSLPYPMWYGLENRCLYPAATAAKIALTLALVKFFGGEITYNDSTCDTPEVFAAPKYIGAHDGKEWERLHQEMLNLAPLTQADIDKCRKWAAY